MAYEKLKHVIRTLNPASYVRVFDEVALVKHLDETLKMSNNPFRVFCEHPLMASVYLGELTTAEYLRESAELGKRGVYKESLSEDRQHNVLRTVELSQVLERFLTRDLGQDVCFLVIPNGDMLLADPKIQLLTSKLLDLRDWNDKQCFQMIFIGLSELPQLPPRLRDRMDVLDERDSQKEDAAAYLKHITDRFEGDSFLPTHLLQAIIPYFNGMSKSQIDRSLADFLITKRYLEKEDKPVDF